MKEKVKLEFEDFLLKIKLACKRVYTMWGGYVKMKEDKRGEFCYISQDFYNKKGSVVIEEVLKYYKNYKIIKAEDYLESEEKIANIKIKTFYKQFINKSKFKQFINEYKEKTAKNFIENEIKKRIKVCTYHDFCLSNYVSNIVSEKNCEYKKIEISKEFINLKDTAFEISLQVVKEINNIFYNLFNESEQIITEKDLFDKLYETKDIILVPGINKKIENSVFKVINTFNTNNFSGVFYKNAISIKAFEPFVEFDSKKMQVSVSMFVFYNFNKKWIFSLI